MASIQSIQDVLKTYQQAYGADALSSQLALFMKSLSSPSAPKPSSEPSSAPAESPLSKLSGQELRDIWADLTGRKKGLKSSGKFSTKDSLIAEIERLRSSSTSVVSSEEPAAAEDKPKSKRSGPSAWNAFVKSVAGDKSSPTAEFLAWKSTQTEKKGNLAFPYASSLGEAAFLEFKRTYVPSSASSVADSASEAPSTTSSSAASAEKKKAGRPKMTDEERSAKQAAKKTAKETERAEKKAARAAEKAAAKAAKKSAKNAPLPNLPESDDEAEADVVYTEVEVGDDTYFWDEVSGDLFNREDDGSFCRIGSYDGISMSFY
jgi:hypothetical protein